MLIALALANLQTFDSLEKVDLTGYRVVWRDEFNQPKLDEKKWQAPVMGRQGPASRWTPEAIAFEDGSLVLKAMPVSEGNIRYACGAVRTRPDYDVKRTYFQQAKGYFEIRAKLLKHVKADTWFAFWIMAGDIRDNQTDSRRGSEIDIIETFSVAQNKMNHAVHWGGYGSTLNSASIPSVELPFLQDGKFHDYGLLWTDTHYYFVVDRKVVGKTDMMGLGRKERTLSQGVCQEPGYLKLTVEAAPWAGASPEWEAGTHQEDRAQVDWIRVYRKDR